MPAVHHLKRSTPCKIQNNRQCLERGLTLGFWALPSTFDPTTPSMRKVDDRENKKEKKRMSFLVATPSLPAVDRPNDDHWNAARSCQ